MNFTSFKLAATSVLFAALTACGGGGGGGGDASQTNPSTPTNAESNQTVPPTNAATNQLVPPTNVATNQLVPLERYAGATGTFQKVNLTMPAGGVLDLALHGTNVRIFDAAMNVVGQAKFSPWGEFQKALEPGAYVIEFEYWSGNAKYAVAYSPTLLAFGNLPQLRNTVYSTGEITTTYHKASFATPAKINFAGSGTSVTIYDSNMQLVDATNSGGTPSYSPVTLPAGDYVFKFMFWSSNSKSVSITSSALPA